MEIKIVWTDFAVEKLSEIFQYYKEVAGADKSQQIVNLIIEKTIYLEKHPAIGVKEELLNKRKKEFRYIVQGNYKIVYWIELNIITIATVFDTRQNPKNLSKLK